MLGMLRARRFAGLLLLARALLGWRRGRSGSLWLSGRHGVTIVRPRAVDVAEVLLNNPLALRMEIGQAGCFVFVLDVVHIVVVVLLVVPLVVLLVVLLVVFVTVVL